jgi:glyoxylase-like metal-dependent hydrolase (beta-lactamase superfamily II)
VVNASVRDQLAAIGYTPDRITFLALSHTHFDHVGNAKDYLGSTWLVQRTEWQLVFAEDLRRPPLEFARFSGLKTSKTVLLDGDHDVFGDGAVVIKSTPGHTPGHQSLFVNLRRTGPVVLAGDLYHYPAERTKHTMPPREAAEGLTAVSRAAMEAFLAKTGAALWIQHDLVHWRQLKKSPEYYD